MRIWTVAASISFSAGYFFPARYYRFRLVLWGADELAPRFERFASPQIPDSEADAPNRRASLWSRLTRRR
jgi:hypothetical protein